VAGLVMANAFMTQMLFSNPTGATLT